MQEPGLWKAQRITVKLVYNHYSLQPMIFGFTLDLAWHFDDTKSFQFPNKIDKSAVPLILLLLLTYAQG